MKNTKTAFQDGHLFCVKSIFSVEQILERSGKRKVKVDLRRKKPSTTTNSSFIQMCISDDVLKALLKVEKQTAEISELERNWEGKIFRHLKSSHRTCSLYI